MEYRFHGRSPKLPIEHIQRSGRRLERGFRRLDCSTAEDRGMVMGNGYERSSRKGPGPNPGKRIPPEKRPQGFFIVLIQTDGDKGWNQQKRTWLELEQATLYPTYEITYSVAATIHLLKDPNVRWKIEHRRT